MSMFSDFMNRAKSQTGGYLADRTGFDGRPPTLPTPNLPTPNDRNLFNVALEGFSGRMSELTGPDSGLMLLGNNLAEAGKGLYRGIENPERTYNENFGGGNWMNRLGMGGGDDDSGGSGSTANTGSGDGTPSSTTDLAQNDAEEERARLDAIRRMLAGRYGRAETNLTGGAGYGSGSGRTIGGFSG
jgi:hypothetical protein